MILFRLERFPVRRTTNSGKKWPSMSSDDPNMADAILNSKTRRDKTLLMLENYKLGE